MWFKESRVTKWSLIARSRFRRQRLLGLGQSRTPLLYRLINPTKQCQHHAVTLKRIVERLRPVFAGQSGKVSPNVARFRDKDCRRAAAG
jgi:hypothetical protein